MEAQKLTNVWQPFNGEYDKQVYAIKLFNGTVHDWAWPNAGVFNLERGGVVELKDVEFVKKGRDDFSH